MSKGSLLIGAAAGEADCVGLLEGMGPGLKNYKNLATVSGGIATVMSTSVTVESDCSASKFVKNACKGRLLNLSLEGILAVRDLGVGTRLAG
jgi:hypothetical protein